MFLLPEREHHLRYLSVSNTEFDTHLHKLSIPLLVRHILGSPSTEASLQGMYNITLLCVRLTLLQASQTFSVQVRVLALYFLDPRGIENLDTRGKLCVTLITVSFSPSQLQ